MGRVMGGRTSLPQPARTGQDGPHRPRPSAYPPSVTRRAKPPTLPVKTKERKRTGGAVVPVTCYLEPAAYLRLKERADRDGRKISTMLERAIAEYLDRLDERERR